MAATDTASEQLRKGTKVVATTDLRGVPEGTEGKVIMVAGFSWIRYWVRFANGVALGSISRHKLATKDDLERQAAGGGAADTSGADDANADGAEAAGDADAGGKATPSGTLVPQKLLDRSAAARVRLSG
jgi:hypothetical protein